MAVRSVENDLKIYMFKRLHPTYSPDAPNGLTSICLIDNDGNDYGLETISWSNPETTSGLEQNGSVVFEITATPSSPVSIVGFRLKFFNGVDEVNGVTETFSQGTYYFTGDGTLTLSSIDIDII